MFNRVDGYAVSPIFRSAKQNSVDLIFMAVEAIYLYLTSSGWLNVEFQFCTDNGVHITLRASRVHERS